MSYFGLYPPANALSDFDVELQYFYSQLLSNIVKNEKITEMVLESLGQERTSHIQKTKSRVPLQNAAYIFRYGACYTSAVANYLLRMIKSNPFIFRNALWKRCVNICCFGNAAVLEIVAMCKIFSMAQDLFWESTLKPLQINFTIIVENSQWEKVTSHLLRVLSEENDIFDTLKMIISVQHVKTKLDVLLNISMREVLKEADIITMVKFPNIRNRVLLQKFIQGVTDCMKIECILFFLDTGMIQHCKLLQQALEPMTGLQNIFGPNNIEPFTLDLKSIQKCVDIFWLRFQGNICLTSCIVNSSAWTKSESTTKVTEIEAPLKLTRKVRQEMARKAKVEWGEMVLKNQKVLESYHQKVRQILLKKKFKRVDKEDDISVLFDYPTLKENILFKSKPKERRIYLS